MNISENFEKMLKDFLVCELKWVEEEIDILFQDKMQEVSEKDKITANLILDNLMKDFLEWNNNELMEILTRTMENIKKKYPNLYK